MGTRAVAVLAPAVALWAAAGFQKAIPKSERTDHALNRLTFGPRPADAARVRAMGLKKWIDLQLHPGRIPENPALEQKLKALDTLRMTAVDLVRNYPAPQVAEQMVRGRLPLPADPEHRLMVERLAARFERRKAQAKPVPPAEEVARILTPEQIRMLRTGPPQERLAAFEALPEDKQDDVIAAIPGVVRQGLYTVAPPELRRRIQMAGSPAQVVATDLMQGKLLRAIYSNRQLQEVLTDFWFNHFNIYLDKGADYYLVTEFERDAIRPHVLGKFRDLLEATAKSPAMLFYLDNWQSVGPNSPAGMRQRRGLNENYGRELMELHTLGVNGGYTQKDVIEVARCFSGWTISRPQLGGEFTFNPRMHEPGAKTVLGVTIPAGGGIEDGEKVLDILATRPATAHFISRELVQRFVADDPPAALVDRMARTFLKTGGDLREVMKTMLNSKEFWSEGAYRAKMKSPLEMVASAVRAVNGDVEDALPLAYQVAQIGEPLYRKIEPTGYSNDSARWLSSAGLVARMNFALQLADDRLPGVKVGQGPNGIALGAPEFQRH
jgi:uncharacterized protein (DUF1800 family)